MRYLTDISQGALCCISVDIDAVAGWLGSYGGEDSTSDISRGIYTLPSAFCNHISIAECIVRPLRRYRRCPQTLKALRQVQYQDDMVYSGSFSRNVSGGVCDDTRCGA